MLFLPRAMKTSIDSLKLAVSWKGSQIPGAKFTVKVCVHCIVCYNSIVQDKQLLKEDYVAMVLGVNNTHGTFVKHLFCTFVLFWFYFPFFLTNTIFFISVFCAIYLIQSITFQTLLNQSFQPFKGGGILSCVNLLLS